MYYQVKSFIEISDKYDFFIFDLWGVVHNGVKLYQPTIRFIEHLRSLGKHIMFLSNSPRPSHVSKEYLYKLGFVLNKNDKLITSGDFFLSYYENNYSGLFGKDQRIYHLGASYNLDLLSGLEMNFTSQIDKANYMIISPETENINELNKYDYTLKIAIKNNVIGICVNPDLIAPHNNKVIYTAGTFAKRYQDFGGVVHYYGKPSLYIYKYALDLLLRQYGITKKRVVAIGDALETDVKGAIAYEIDSLLLLNGVHRNIGPNLNLSIQSLFTEFKIEPTLVMKEPKFC